MINHGPPLLSQGSPGAGGGVKGLQGKKRTPWQTDWRDFWLNDVTFLMWPLLNYQTLTFVLKKIHQKCEEDDTIFFFNTYNFKTCQLPATDSADDNSYVFLRMWMPVMGGSTYRWRRRDLGEEEHVSCSVYSPHWTSHFCSRSSVTSCDPVNCLLGTPL